METRASISASQHKVGFQWVRYFSLSDGHFLGVSSHGRVTVISLLTKALILLWDYHLTKWSNVSSKDCVSKYHHVCVRVSSHELRTKFFHCRSWEKNYYTWDFQIMLEAWRKLNLCGPMTLTESSYFTFTNVLSLWSSLHPMFLVVCTQFSCTVEFPGSLCFCFLIILLIHCLLLWGSFHFILLHWISAKKKYLHENFKSFVTISSCGSKVFCNSQMYF